MSPPDDHRASGEQRSARPEPVQEYFSIGDVCALTGLKPHVLRYWETQFRVLRPAKNRSGNRVYARREVELVLLVKQLLYAEKYTVDGARQKLDEQRRSGALRGAARAALRRETAHELERELTAVIDLLEGRQRPTRAATPKAADDARSEAEAAGSDERLRPAGGGERAAQIAPARETAA